MIVEDDKQFTTSNSKTTNTSNRTVKVAEPNISNETKKMQENENIREMATEDAPLLLFKKMSLDECTKEPVSLSKTIPSLGDRNTNQQDSTESMEDEEQPINSSSNTANEPQAIENMDVGEASCSSAALDKDPLDGWTKTDMYHLYVGVKTFGSAKVEKIQEKIRTKTVEEIKGALVHLKNESYRNPKCMTIRLKKRKQETKPLVIPLASWAKELTDHRQYEELQTETVTALRYIADMENIPPPSKTEQIDFRKVYHHLADRMEGKPVVKDKLIDKVLHSCIIDTVIQAKKFINVNTFKKIVDGVDFEDKPSSSFPQQTEDCELFLAQKFASQPSYNPLNIPLENLLPNLSNEPVEDPK